MTRTILVTGAARRIGAAIAGQLAASGHHVIAHYRHSSDEIEAAAEAWRRNGGTVTLISGDLAAAGAGERLMASAREAAGGAIDGLVNCASLFDFDRPPAIDGALLDVSMQTNLVAPVELSTALARQADLTDGAIVNVLDQKIANLNPDFFSYTLSKTALESATVMLAQALAPKVRVNAVSPGLTLASLDQTDVEFNAVARDNLLQRPVELSDIATSVEWLLSARSITGQNVFIDCGQRFLTRDSDVMFATRNRVIG